MGVCILGNRTDWLDVCLQSVKNKKNINFINTDLPLNKKKSIKNFLVKLHYSYTLQHIVNIPFKNIWYGYFLKNMFLDNSAENVLIIFDRNRLANDEKFLKYIRKKIKNIKIAYYFTNIVGISGASNNKFINKLSMYYDKIFTFDESDAKKMGYIYLPLPYSSILSQKKADNEQCFYCGRAKERLSMIMDVYKRLKEINISRKFYLFNVSQEEQEFKDDIVYNQLIPYRDVVKMVNDSGCIIEIIQQNSTGYTLKTVEAIYYNKLLISNNEYLKNAPFYNSKYIKIIKKPKDIQVEWFKNIGNINYSSIDRNYFSADNFIMTIKKNLVDSKTTDILRKC